MLVSHVLVQRLPVVEHPVTLSTTELLHSVSHSLVTVEILLGVEYFLTLVTGENVLLAGVNASFVLIETDLKAKHHLADVTLELLGLLQPLPLMPAKIVLVHKTCVAVFTRKPQIFMLGPNVMPQLLLAHASVAAPIAIVPLALVFHCNVFLQGGIASC